MDTIRINELHARCILGVGEEERREKQDVVIHLELETDCRQPGKSDRFEDAVDYRAIKKQVLALVEGSQFFLLEALSEAIANTCLYHPAVNRARVQVEKPSALRFARSVAVSIEREQNAEVRAFIALGSNQEPETHLEQALQRLARQVKLMSLSTIYRSPAIGRPEQPDYLNAVVEVRTSLSPLALKYHVLRRIELELGRRRDLDPYAPRAIDLDLLLHGQAQVASWDLSLPDPVILERAFLARALRELAPGLELPGLGLDLETICSGLASEPLSPQDALTEKLRRITQHEHPKR